MAKAVRWVVPFQSRKGVNYEIRIYDNYTGTKPSSWPITLQAGEVPITTNEDKSDDFFTSVRTSTGTIQVVDTDGTLLEQLIPDNNTHRPIRLIKKGATSAQDTVEWQGFLSSEVYTQEYTAVARIIDINIISVLEAMDSIRLDVTTASIKKIRSAIADALIKMTRFTPSYIFDDDIYQCYDSIFFSYEAKDILEKYIDTTILFNKEAIAVENAIRYEVTGITCLEIIKKIATFMGLVVREQGSNLYFQRIGESVGMNEYTYYHFTTDGIYSQTVYNADINISDLTYVGNTHSKSISQGSKSVSVLANITKYNLELNLPPLEYGVLNHYHSYFLDADLYIDEYSSQLTTITTRHYSIEVAKWILVPGYASTYGPSGRNQAVSTEHDIMLQSLAVKGTSAPVRQNNVTDYVRLYTGAMMCNARFSGESNYTEGLYCLLLPNTIGTASNPSRVNFVDPIVELTDPLLTTYDSGYFKISTDAKVIQNANLPTISESGYLLISIKHNEQYWNPDTNSWGAECKFKIELENGNFKSNWTSEMGVVETSGYLIPVNPNKIGHFEVYIWPMASEAINQPLSNIYGIAEMFMASLICEHVPMVQPEDDGRSVNRYYKNLLANFKEDYKLSTDLCTYNANKHSPSIIRTDNNGTNMTKMSYYTDSVGTVSIRRPEKDLLDRLVSYYQSTRRNIELIVEHPTTEALPLLHIDANTTDNPGYDGKLYLPLAEDREWQQDISKITCFETYEGD